MYFLIEQELWNPIDQTGEERPLTGEEELDIANREYFPMLQIRDLLGADKFSFLPSYWTGRPPKTHGRWEEEQGLPRPLQNYYYLEGHLLDTAYEIGRKPVRVDGTLYFSDIKAFRQEDRGFTDIFFRQEGLDLVANLVSRAKDC